MDSVISLDGLSFDDVSIKPKLIKNSPEIVSLESEVFRGFYSTIPVIPAPMNDIFSSALASELSHFNIACPFPREFDYAHTKNLPANTSHIPRVATASPFRPELVKFLLASPHFDYIILDSVAVYNSKVFELLDSIDSNHHQKIIVGNIATKEAASDFSQYPLAALKVGLGSGSICTTTEITGIGIPQLQAISEVSSVLKDSGIPLISDGGIRNTGDIIKALGAGANSIMMGKLFAATTEAASKIYIHDGIEYKRYEGAEYATIELDQEADVFRKLEADSFKYLDKHRSEGVSGLIKHKGPVRFLLEHIKRSCSAAVSFVGASNLTEFRKNVEFVKRSPAAGIESRSHGIDIVSKNNRLI